MTELLTAQETRKILRLGKNAIYDLARARKIEKALIKLEAKVVELREKIKKEVEL